MFTLAMYYFPPVFGPHQVWPGHSPDPGVPCRHFFRAVKLDMRSIINVAAPLCGFRNIIILLWAVRLGPACRHRPVSPGAF